MAFRINCGKPEKNEVAALNRLAAELSDDWALFTSVPRHLTGQGARGREIDALALSPRGAVVIELKHFGGLITVTPVGEWIVTGKMLTDRQGTPQYPLQQAGKAAQVLKTALGEAARTVYIEACAVATIPGARIRFADPARPQEAMSIDDVVEGIETLARRTRGVSYPALQAFFELVGHGIPPKLATSWRASAAAESRRSLYSKRGRTPAQAVRRSDNIDRGRHREQSEPILLWLVLAVISGSLIGWFILTLGSPN